MKKLPAMQWYCGDWMKDPGIRSLSLAARGLWFDMLNLMHESARRGYLQHGNDKPISPDQLARMTGSSAEEVSRLLQELETSGVYSRTEFGVIFCRRMVRDEHKRQKCAEAGKRGGGNPRLLDPTFKGEPKGGVKGHSKGVPKASSSFSSSDENHVCVATELPKIVGVGPSGEIPPSGPLREFFDRWNSTPGAKPETAMHHLQWRKLATRLEEPSWRWQLALSRFPLAYWQDQGGMGIYKFLEDGVVDAIIQGSYRKKVSDGRTANQSRKSQGGDGAGKVFDSSAPAASDDSVTGKF